ncbi:sensor histidine kinase [Minicystis rosea]|nr:sensor histidine kinase [Minicystis rosea]
MLPGLRRRAGALLAIRGSVRLQLIGSMLLCAIGALVLPLPINLLDLAFHRMPREHARGMDRIDEVGQALAHALDEPDRPADVATIARLLDGLVHKFNSGPLTARVVNRDGHVVLATAGSVPGDVDVPRALRVAAAERAAPERYDGHGDYAVVYAVTQRGEPGYLLVAGVPRREHTGCIVRAVTSGAWPFLFVALFFVATRRKLAQLRTIGEGLSAIAAGRLDHRLSDQGQDELGALARNVNAMADALERNIEAERRAERTKDELIAHVSHDLRTPLTSITGYLDLVRLGRYDGAAQLADYVGIAHGKAEQLQRMIEDLFEYVRLRDPHLRLARRVVCIHALVAQLASEYVPLCESAGVTLDTDLPKGRAPLAVDPDRLVRVLDNLLSNAIKYSHVPGHVRVSLRDAGGAIQITVENTGPTLSASDLTRIFERFFRVDAVGAPPVRGAGLGLAVAKSIVELHGGSIWAESEAGVVRVHVRLPRATPDA